MKEDEQKKIWIFPGVTSPNTTKVPDQYLDELLSVLSGGELKVLLYITRRTFGFKKDSDNISLSQMLHGIQTRDGRILDRGVGLSKKTLLQAVRSLENHHIIQTQRRQSPEKGNEPTTYRLNILAAPPSVKSTPPLGEKFPQGGGGEIPPSPRGRNSATQQTVKQETALHINSTSKEENTRLKTSNRRGGVGENQTRTQSPLTADTQGVYEQLRSAQASLTPNGERVTQAPLPKTRGRPPKPTPYLEQLLRDWSDEFHDSEHTRSNVTRAMRLYKASGLSEEAFVATLYEARSIVKQRGNIQKTSSDLAPLKNRAPYWFAVVEDLLGVRRPS